MSVAGDVWLAVRSCGAVSMLVERLERSESLCRYAGSKSREAESCKPAKQPNHEEANVSVAVAPSAPDSADAPPVERARRVLVLYERSQSATAALREAAELTSAGGELAVVALAPQADPARCCGPGPGGYNCAIREEAQLDLREAREILGPAAERSTFKVLIERRDPPLAAWVAEQDFDTVLLPARRLTLGGHRAARKLRSSGAKEIRVVPSQP